MFTHILSINERSMHFISSLGKKHSTGSETSFFQTPITSKNFLSESSLPVFLALGITAQSSLDPLLSLDARNLNVFSAFFNKWTILISCLFFIFQYRKTQEALQYFQDVMTYTIPKVFLDTVSADETKTHFL